MERLSLPAIESIDVEDLLTLPEGYRYELHGGNLVIMTPSTYRCGQRTARRQA